MSSQMKKLFPLAVLFPVLALAIIPSGPVPITLFWVNTNAPGSVDAFYLYSATSPIQPLPWTPLTNAPGSASNVIVNMLPGQYYFYCTASNFWGETGPSNVTNTPIVLSNNPSGLNLHR